MDFQEGDDSIFLVMVNYFPHLSIVCMCVNSSFSCLHDTGRLVPNFGDINGVDAIHAFSVTQPTYLLCSN